MSIPKYLTDRNGQRYRNLADPSNYADTELGRMLQQAHDAVVTSTQKPDANEVARLRQNDAETKNAVYPTHRR